MLKWPYPVAVSVSFAVAASVAFVLNKVLNFRAHGDTGRQSGRYLLVVVTNYVLWILGFSWMLNALGVPPELARILAAFVEGIYIYFCPGCGSFGGDSRRRSRGRAHSSRAMMSM